MTTTLGNDNSNVLNGSNGTDYLMGDGGLFDIIIGNNGEDIAFYQGRVLDYVFLELLGQLLVVDTQITRDGIDNLRSIEYVQFDTSTSFFQANMNIPANLIQLPSLYHLQIGGGGNNVIVGDNAGALTNQDLMLGFSGGDTFYITKGMDVAYGYAGNDAFNYSVVSANAIASRLGYAYLDGGANTDTLTLNFSGFASNGLTLSAILTAFNASNHSQVFDFSTIDSRIKLQVINIENLVVQNFLENHEATAVNLLNQVSSVAENGGAVKVADIQVVDDGLGTNNLSLSGAEASSFYLVGNALWFNGGANFEAKNVYKVIVNVDDPNLPGNPGINKSFTLNISDVNEEASAILLTNQLSSVAENGAAVKVANVVITDDALGTNTLILEGADASSFYLVGNALWFNGGANFENKQSYDVSVRVDDTTIAGVNSINAPFHLNITDVNEEATAINLVNQVLAVNEHAGAVKVADIQITDDALGTNTLILEGADASSFHLVGNALWFNGNADFLTKSSYDVSVRVDDLTIAGVNNVLADFHLNVSQVNQAPTANPDVYNVLENGAVSANALHNDTDLENNIMFLREPADQLVLTYGTLNILITGDLLYRANVDSLSQGQVGQDTYTYSVRDQYGAISNSTTITFNVTGVNDAPIAVNDISSVNEHASVSFNILSNDTDVDALDTKSVSPESVGTFATTFGHITIDSSGNATYIADNTGPTADGQTRLDSFTYTITDNHGATSTATINLTINGVNDAPVAAPVEASVLESGTVLLNTAGSDPLDGIPVSTITATQVGTYGVLQIFDSSGAAKYTASNAERLSAGETVEDTFIYRVRDGAGIIAESTITIHVTGTNDAPIAVNDAATVDDTATVYFNVLTNDIEVDLLDSKAVVNYGTFELEYGVLTIEPDGTAQYTANTESARALAEGEIAQDFFEYMLMDNAGETSIATITIDVVGKNDAPVAAPETYTGFQNLQVIIPQNAGILANDLDIDGDTIFPIIVTGTMHGSLSLNSDGSFVYEPDPGFSGTDTFIYKLTDGSLFSEDTTVTINVQSITPRYFDASAVNIPNHTEVLTNAATGTPDIIIINAPAHNPASNPEVLGGMLNASINGSNQYQIIMNNASQFGQATFSDITPAVNSIIQFQVSGVLTDVALYNNLNNVNTMTANIAFFLDGNDTATGTSGNDYINMGAGSDTVTGGGGNDTLVGGTGSDEFSYAGGAGSINQGVDHIVDFSVLGQDRLVINGFATANDVMKNIDFTGASGHLVMTISNGTVVHFDNLISSIPVTLSFNNPNFSVDIHTPSGNTVNEISGGAFLMEGDDIAFGKVGDNFISGGAGNDRIYGDGLSVSDVTAGNDILLGGAGDDRLYGDAANMTNSLGGNDTLSGGAGSDRFIYLLGAGTANQGVDHITDFSRVGTANPDIITFFGTFASQSDLLSNLSFSLPSDHLVLTLANGTVIHFDNLLDTGLPNFPITLQFEYNDASLGLQVISVDVFTNQTNDTFEISRPAFFLGGNDGAIGSAADNYISGGAGNDTIGGDPAFESGGNDTLIGGAGNDKFVYSLGAAAPSQGVDHIMDFGRVGSATPDVIKFLGNFASQNAMLSNLSFSISNGHLVMNLANGTVVHFDSLLDTGLPNFPITLQLEYNHASLGLQVINVDVFTNQTNDTIEISRPAFFVGGDDGATGSAADNYISGGAGNDTIGGDPSFLSGGNDTLVGGEGNDKFVYSLGAAAPSQGVDHILDFAKVGSAQPDILKFEGSFASVSDFLSNISATSASGHYILSLSNGTAIHLDNLAPGAAGTATTIQMQYTHATLGLQTINVDLFTDGSDNATAGNHVLALAGNDFIAGNSSNQYFNAGDGADTIYADATELMDATGGNDVLIGGNGNDTLYGDAQILTDGNGGDDVLIGGAGNDRLYGDGETARVSGEPGAISTSGDDILNGGAGNDMLWGDVAIRTGSFTAGTDTFIYNSDVNEGNDTIVDYSLAGDIDIIQLNSATAFSNALALLERISINVVNGMYVMSFESGTTITFSNKLVNNTPNTSTPLFYIQYTDAVLGDQIIAIKAYSNVNDTSLPLTQDTYMYLLGGNDVANGPSNSFNNINLMIGGFGNDTLSGLAGDDILYGEGSLLSSATGGNDTLNGNDGNDTIYGDAHTMNNNATGGDDTLEGDNGDDLIYGDAVNMTGSTAGIDTIDGGDGDDIIYGDAVNMTNSIGGDDDINGGADNDTLYGDGADLLNSQGGDDSIQGGNGRSVIYGDAINMTNSTGGLDTVTGANSDDIIYGDARVMANVSIGGNDIINAAGGADLIYGDAETITSSVAGNDRIDGAAGNDSIYGDSVNMANSLAGNDIINGGSENDLIYGDAVNMTGSTAGIDTIDGGDGDDIIYGDAVTLTNSVARNDSIKGSAGADLIYGDALSMNGSSAGNDVIDGGLGNDELYGDGADLLNSQGGDDSIQGGNGRSVIYGDAINMTNSTGGLDTVAGANSDDIIYGDARVMENVSIGGNDIINAAGGADLIYGDAETITSSVAGNDRIDGAAGNDSIYGDAVNMTGSTAGNDIINGGSENDLIYGDAVNMTGSTAGIDTIDGGDGDDIIYGDAITLTNSVARNDSIKGSAGADLIYGDALSMNGSSAGNDVIEGGLGNDELYGDTKASNVVGAFAGGADIFVYDTLTNEGVDTIGDFNIGGVADTIRIKPNAQFDPFSLLTFINFSVANGHYVLTLTGGTVINFINMPANGDNVSFRIEYYQTGSPVGTFESLIVNLPEAHFADLSADIGVVNITGLFDSVRFFASGDGFPAQFAHTADVLEHVDFSIVNGKYVLTLNSGTIFNFENLPVNIGGPATIIRIQYDQTGTPLNDYEQFNLSMNALSDSNVVFIGTDDSNVVFGGTGNDVIAGDLLHTLPVNFSDDLLKGGAGDDTITGDFSSMTNSVGGNDIIQGDAGNDIIYGDAINMTNSVGGNDIIEGGLGNDILSGDGNPSGSFTGGADTFVYSLLANEGSDEIRDFNAGGVADSIMFKDSNLFANPLDLLQHVRFDVVGGLYTMTLDSGTVVNFSSLAPHADGSPTTLKFEYDQLGTNPAVHETFNVSLYTDADDSSLNIQQGVYYFLGGGDETLNGNNGDDFIDAGAGVDRIMGDRSTMLSGATGGDDILRGGSGNDQLFGDTDTLSGVNGGNDIILGGDGDDRIYGDGRVMLNADAGSDLINGGKGNDTMSGDVGTNQGGNLFASDTFVFNLANGGDGNDIITDFNIGGAAAADFLSFENVVDANNNGNLLEDLLAMSQVVNNAGHAQLQFTLSGGATASIDFNNISYTGQTEVTNIALAGHLMVNGVVVA